MVRLSKKWFNPLYWHILDALKNPDIRFVGTYGGSSSAKSYSIQQALIVDQLSQGYNTIMFRKERESIADTIGNDIDEIIEYLGLSPIHKKIRNKHIWETGPYIRLRGADKPDKIKGLKGFQKVYWDEMDQFTYEDFKEMRRRLRGDVNMKFLGSWNPISVEHWLFKQWYSPSDLIDLPLMLEGNLMSELHHTSEKKISADGSTLFIQTNYLDNKWVVGDEKFGRGRYDEHVIREFEDMKGYDSDDYMVYGLGKWGRPKKGGEWFKKFDYSKHVGECDYDPNLPLHISFDFNTVPYVTLLVFQIDFNGQRTMVKQIDEICSEYPDNTTEDACREFIYRYSGHKSGVYVYGDASGRNRTTVSKEHRHDYEVIQSVLREYLYEGSMRVPRSNPRVNKARDFVNRMLAGVYDVHIQIHPACEKTIRDLTEVKQDANGGFLKKKVKDPKTGVSYEPVGHTGDAFKYFVVDGFRNIYDMI